MISIQLVKSLPHPPVDAPARLEPIETPQIQHDPKPLVLIFVAFIIAFHVSALLTGLIVAWVFYWRYSGAFA